MSFKFIVVSTDDGRWTIADRDNGQALSDYSLTLRQANALVIKLNNAWGAAKWK